MQVNFYATFRQVAGAKTIDFDLQDGATLGALFATIIAAYPAMRDEMLDEKGQLGEHIRVFINERDVSYLDHFLDTPLKAGDVISIFPPLGGG
jgi:molybdopterin synthase sulfur carrier subunit